MKKWVAIFALSTVCVGCSFVGPRILLNGRGTYNEVLNRTSDQQILNMIVKLRYAETFGFLRVASVTANIKVKGSIGANFGIGPNRNYDGNLVPLSAGLAYEENPTISYIPHGGETYVRGFMTPYPLDTLLLFGRAMLQSDVLLRFAVSQLNRVHNPTLQHGDEAQPFEELAALITRLRAANVLEFAEARERKDELMLVLFGYAPDYNDDVAELLQRLAIQAPPPDDGGDVIVPMRSAIGSNDGETINVETRSLTQILRHVSLGIEIPEVHLQEGIVEECPSISEARQLIRIQSSESRPDRAMVEIRNHDWWFYIDSADVKSKTGFTFLQFLLGYHFEPGEAVQEAPVLTIGVAG